MNYKGEELTTLYIGGGTPSALNLNELSQLFEVLKELKRSSDCEFTIEVNIENIDTDKLELMYKSGVNRLSIGVQTLNEKLITYLGRKHDRKMVFNRVELAKKVGFTNINIDLMYGIKNQTINDLIEDIKLYKKLDVPHISTYSLIIEKNTMLSVNKEEYIDEELDLEMYNLIIDSLSEYNHYEVSNFAKKNYESKHNLTYWNNNEYYGFGLGASGYVRNERYTNTRNLTKYIDGDYISEKYLVSEKEKLENEFILGLRKMSGINKFDFLEKYGYDVGKIDIVNKLILESKLIDDGENVYIPKELIYVSNEILVDFLVDDED